MKSQTLSGCPSLTDSELKVYDAHWSLRARGAGEKQKWPPTVSSRTSWSPDDLDGFVRGRAALGVRPVKSGKSPHTGDQASLGPAGVKAQSVAPPSRVTSLAHPRFGYERLSFIERGRDEKRSGSVERLRSIGRVDWMRWNHDGASASATRRADVPAATAHARGAERARRRQRVLLRAMGHDQPGAARLERVRVAAQRVVRARNDDERRRRADVRRDAVGASVRQRVVGVDRLGLQVPHCLADRSGRVDQDADRELDLLSKRLSVQSEFPERCRRVVRRGGESPELQRRPGNAVRRERMGERKDERSHSHGPAAGRPAGRHVSAERDLLQGRVARQVRSRRHTRRAVPCRRPARTSPPS